MRLLLLILLSPLVAVCRFGLEVLIWFRPNVAFGRRRFPGSVKRLIARAKSVEVHYAELGSDEPAGEGPLGTKMGWRSLGMVPVKSWWLRRWVIRSVLKANRESLGGFKCLDAEYGLRFHSELGCADLMICFRCAQVWVSAQVEGGEQYYPISCRPLALLDWLLQTGGVARPADHDHSDAEPAITGGEAAGVKLSAPARGVPGALGVVPEVASGSQESESVSRKLLPEPGVARGGPTTVAAEH